MYYREFTPFLRPRFFAQIQRVTAFTCRSLALIAVVCAVAGCDAPSESTEAWPEVAEAEWTVLALFEQPIIRGSRLTVQTSATGIGGYSGCNWYGMRRDSLRRGVEMTARACTRPAGLMEQEQRFVSALTKGAVAVRKGDTLIVRDSGGAAILTLLRRTPTGADASQLPGTSWVLRRSTNRTLDTTATMRFTSDSVSGFAGCRNYVGSWTGSADRLRFTYISMTSMDCPDDRRRRREEELTTVMSETSYFALTPTILTLFTWGGDTVAFAKADQRR
jgi:heat shock protein HslJ